MPSHVPHAFLLGQFILAAHMLPCSDYLHNALLWRDNVPVCVLTHAHPVSVARVVT